MNLIGQVGNYRTNKCLTVAEFSNQKVTFQNQTNLKDKEFLQKNPQGKCPILETSEGIMNQSNAIIRYLSNKSKSLYGETDFEKQQVDQWIEYCSYELEPVYLQLTLPFFGQLQENPSLKTLAVKDLHSVFKVLNEHLKLRSFFVGHKLTIADITIASTLYYLYKFIIDAKLRQLYVNVYRWFNFVTNQSLWQNIWGKTYYNQQQLVVAELPKTENQQPQQKQKQDQKQEQKPKKEQKQQPKKEEKKVEKKEEKKVEKKEDQDVQDVFASKKNPLDLLPETSFNLFDFKTQIVNEKDKQKSVDFLFQNIDPKGFSLWKVEYEKYPGEGEKLYMTSNLANGFLQRLEHFRKYCIGVWGVYGEEPNLEIRGLFLWRGTEKPAEILDHASYDYHKFTKLEISDPQTKQLVSDYWCNLNPDQKVEGLSAQQVKYFK